MSAQQYPAYFRDNIVFHYTTSTMTDSKALNPNETSFALKVFANMKAKPDVSLKQKE